MRPLILLANCIAFFIVVIVGNSTPDAEKFVQTATVPKNAQEKCEAPDSWFKDGKTPKPKFEVSSAEKECEFYQFAWQSFLYLTQPEDGRDYPRFFDFKSPNDLFTDPSGKKTQIVALPKSFKDEKTKRLPLTIRTTGTRGLGDIGALSIEQAGSQGVLVDQNNRAVYSGIHLNDAYVDFFKVGLNIKKPEDIKNIDKTAMFPAECYELKSSWRILTDDETKPENLIKLQAKYLVADVLVSTIFKDKDGKIKADPAKPRPEKAVMLGLHVVATLKGHPEFVWSSFEHVDNSPTWGKMGSPVLTVIDGTRDYTLYRKGKKGLECNKNPVASGTNPLTLVDANKQTLSPIVDVFRLFTSGDGGVGEDGDVSSLNASVVSKLNGDLAVWKNYRLIGAVWLKKPAQSFVEDKEFKDDDLAGETRLSNSTMETFTQLSQVNCFSCHMTKAITENGKTLPASRVKVSHVFRIVYFSAP